MKISHKGFISPLLLALIALLILGGGAYVYTHKICALPLLYCPAGTHNVFNSVTCSQKCVTDESSATQASATSSVQIYKKQLETRLENMYK